MAILTRVYPGQFAFTVSDSWNFVTINGSGPFQISGGWMSASGCLALFDQYFQFDSGLCVNKILLVPRYVDASFDPLCASEVVNGVPIVLRDELVEQEAAQAFSDASIQYQHNWTGGVIGVLVRTKV
ncbi:MAG: hypothetical protein SFX74_05060 [Fimbriimonadaceae bacterium]|nr:hypothetical protein [Fimbriimonadaceae bacterium]